MCQNKSSYFCILECIKHYFLIHLYNVISLVTALPIWKCLVNYGPIHLTDFTIFCFNFIHLFIFINISYYYVTSNQNESDGNIIVSIQQITTKVNFQIQIVVASIKEKHTLLRKQKRENNFELDGNRQDLTN